MRTCEVSLGRSAVPFVCLCRPLCLEPVVSISAAWNCQLGSLVHFSLLQAICSSWSHFSYCVTLLCSVALLSWWILLCDPAMVSLLVPAAGGEGALKASGMNLSFARPGLPGYEAPVSKRANPAGFSWVWTVCKGLNGALSMGIVTWLVSAKHRRRIPWRWSKVGLEIYTEGAQECLCFFMAKRLGLDLPRPVPPCLWQRVQEYMPRQACSDTFWHGSSCYTFFVYSGPKRQNFFKLKRKKRPCFYFIF